MQSFTFDQLDERGQQAVIDRYYNDSCSQNYVEFIQNMNADECPLVEDWAREQNIRFTIHGERVA